MTNEEIDKYADKKLKKQENRVLIKYLGLAFLGGMGIVLMSQPIEYGCPDVYGLILAVIILISFFALLVAFAFALEKGWYKHRRNYVYNLVRQDERKRCMNKMERYKQEGSR